MNKDVLIVVNGEFLQEQMNKDVLIVVNGEFLQEQMNKDVLIVVNGEFLLYKASYLLLSFQAFSHSPS